MVTAVEHSQLTGASLHEPKGITGAATNTIYVANGTGSGSWAKLNANNLSGTGNSFGSQLLHVRGSDTGLASWATGYNNFILNSTVTNEIAGATVVSNVISLPAGTYFMMSRVDLDSASPDVPTAARLYNSTTSTSLIPLPKFYGTSFDLNGRFTLAGSSSLVLQGTITLGPSSETYISEVLIWKVS